MILCIAAISLSVIFPSDIATTTQRSKSSFSALAPWTGIISGYIFLICSSIAALNWFLYSVNACGGRGSAKFLTRFDSATAEMIFSLNGVKGCVVRIVSKSESEICSTWSKIIFSTFWSWSSARIFFEVRPVVYFSNAAEKFSVLQSQLKKPAISHETSEQMSHCKMSLFSSMASANSNSDSSTAFAGM